MKSLLIALSALVVGAALPSSVSAQATAVAALPPGGLTIAGPGFVTGGTVRTVWTSATGLSICATATLIGGVTTQFNSTIKLFPSAVSHSFAAGQQTGTLCGTGVTTVQITSPNGVTSFWRIDRTN